MLTKQQRESLSDAKLLCETAAAIKASLAPIEMRQGQLVPNANNAVMLAKYTVFLADKALDAIGEAFPQET